MHQPLGFLMFSFFSKPSHFGQLLVFSHMLPKSQSSDTVGGHLYELAASVVTQGPAQTVTMLYSHHLEILNNLFFEAK